MMKRLYLLLNLILLVFLSVTGVAAQTTHIVQRGDTLGSIAQRYGTTITALAQANNVVNPNLIYVGQSLIVSSGGGGSSAEPPPDTLPNQYVVQRGDTLASIGLRFGRTVGALQRANNIANANLIYVGQRLAIPSGDGFTPAPPIASGQKRIVVDKSEQRAYASQGGALIWTFIVSTGEPGKETWNGTWAIRTKLPNAYASLWDLQMPYWLGFYHTGYLENGFHALPIMPDGTILWDGYLGTPVSYGCVILSHTDAQTLYNWAEIGTEVVVQD